MSSDYAECSAGKNQSPVDLSRAAATSERSVVFHYQPARYRVENNGHALQATPEGGGQFVRIGGESFALKQFHFHAPSEHTFKGRHFPLEAHFVHQSTQGALAVVAVDALTYSGFKVLAALYHLELAAIPCRPEGPDLQALHTLCQQRRVRAVCIPGAALAPDQHRRLRVRLKFSRRRWLAPE